MMKGLGKPLLVWVLALGLGGLTASAHEDTILSLKDGKLVTREGMAEAYQVPKEFQPLEFDAATHRVRIGKKEMKLIPFLADLFPDDGKYKFHFSSSWYHDAETLPPYLLMKIEPEGRQFRYELRLNMKELDVIKLEVVLDLGGGTRQGLPVDLGYWRKAIRESIKVVEEK